MWCLQFWLDFQQSCLNGYQVMFLLLLNHNSVGNVWELIKYVNTVFCAQLPGK